MVLNQETGNTSAADKQRADILFEQTGVAHYLDKADYSTAMKDILDKYNKSGSWDSYLSMDNWQQSIKDYKCPENCMMQIGVETVWQMLDGSFSGDKQTMKQLRKLYKKMYLYYGVTAEDIKNETERYKSLLGVLCS